MTKTTLLRANHRGQTEFIHKNIRSDGEIDNFTLHGVAVRQVERFTGEYMVRERFRRELPRWSRVESCLKYDLHDSYPATEEATTYFVDYPTKNARIEVYFPQGRPAREPRACCEIGAETRDLHRPNLTPNGLHLSWEMKNLKPGSRYFIWWHW